MRNMELAAYLTHCNLQPLHMFISLRSVMALRGIWEGSTMVGGKRVVCEEGQGDGEEEEQTDNIATLLPTNNYSRDILQRLPRASAGGWGGSRREFTV